MLGILLVHNYKLSMSLQIISLIFKHSTNISKYLKSEVWLALYIEIICISCYLGMVYIVTTDIHSRKLTHCVDTFFPDITRVSLVFTFI